MVLTRPLVILSLGLLVLTRFLFLVAGVSTGDPDTRARPNIVLIIGDDIGSRDIGFIGSDISTPHLDELAAQGVRLTRHYTQPKCAPTRGELLTGRYEITMGSQLTKLGPCSMTGLPLEYDTMADILKSAGYRTHAVGKWHLGFYKKEYTPQYRGFDSFYGILPDRSDHYNYKDCFTVEEDNVSMCGYSLLDGDLPDYSANGTFSSIAYTTRAVEIIKDSGNSSEPMFLYLAYTAPHSPIQTPEYYQDSLINIVNDQRRRYAGMIASVDEGVYNVTQALTEAGMWDNTVLIFLSDNGGEITYGSSNWPLRGQKMTWWEGGVKNNAFVVSPLLEKKRQGRASGGLMHVTDWLPTVAEIAGIRLNESLGLDGVSQWPMIKDGSLSARREILHFINEERTLLPGPRISNGTFNANITAALRVGSYKLLTGNPGDAGWYAVPQEKDNVLNGPDLSDKNIWLFDIFRDPDELNDLSAKMPEKVVEMLDRLVYYDTIAKPVEPVYIDYKCDPDLYGGYWTPWVD